MNTMDAHPVYSQHKVLGIFLCRSPPYFLKQCFSVNQNLSIWLTSKCQGAAYLCPPMLGLQELTANPIPHVVTGVQTQSLTPAEQVTESCTPPQFLN